MPCAPSISLAKVDPTFGLAPKMCHQDRVAEIVDRLHGISLKPDSDRDIKKINASLQMLKTSGWFYENIDRHEAKALLQGYPEGTFLMRNSSDSRYLFALSVQTRRGITSVRIVYNHGKFHLDCEDALAGQMPMFDNVVDLVSFYVKLSKHDKHNQCVWLERTGRRDLPVKLIKPVLKNVQSLQHICRGAITSVTSPRNIDTLPLPKPLKYFLKEYPHPL